MTNAILIEETGTDWEPGFNNKFYAQRGEGKFAFGPTPEAALAALLAAEAAAQPQPAKIGATRLVEACGTVWHACDVIGDNPASDRRYWVVKNSTIISVAKPGIVGFYASSIEDACAQLVN